MTKKIFFVVGEPSGDALGAQLIQSLQAQSTEPLAFSGVGGPLMEATGVFKSQLPMDELCVMGIWEVLAQLSRLKKLIAGIAEEIEDQDVDLLVTIDLPDFNFHLGQLLKERKFSKARHVHYVAPSVWAWRPGRAPKIASFLDGLLCLFPFEPQYFAPHGLKSLYAGHPMTRTFKPDVDVAGFKAKYQIPEGVPTLGVFFGSRVSELKVHGPIIKETIQILREQYKNLHLIVPTLPQLEYQVLHLLSEIGCPSYVINKQESKWQAFAACDAAVAVSGTVGLELAYAGVPHVICYKTHPVTAGLLKILVKVKYAHLANIMLNKEVVPEFLQGKCISLPIAKGIFRLMKSEKAAKKQKQELSELHELMALDGGLSPGMKAAQFVLELLHMPPRETIKKPKPSAQAPQKVVNKTAPVGTSDLQDGQSDTPKKEMHPTAASLMKKINHAKTSSSALAKIIDPIIEKYAAYQAKKSQGQNTPPET